MAQLNRAHIKIYTGLLFNGALIHSIIQIYNKTYLITDLCEMSTRGQSLRVDLDLKGTTHVHEVKVTRARHPGSVT